MHPEIERQLAAERIRELRRAGAVSRLKKASPRVMSAPEVSIRAARADDGLAVAALAVLDDTVPPGGDMLVAEVHGSILAVLPLDGSPPFADPFRRTADLVALLKARAAQLSAARDGGDDGHGRLGWLTPAALRRLV
jgi:hypothetical protein